MKRILFALTLAAITFPLTSNTAYADTPETSSEVQGKRFSHINGMPIKVGEHNEYYYDHKRFNISANPIGPIFGYFSVSGSVALSNRIAVRGELSFYHDPDGYDEETISSVSVGTTIYFKKMYSGFFLEPGVAHIRASNENYWDGGTHVKTHMGPQVIAGWQWTWDSGLSMMAGFGALRGYESDGEHRDTDIIPRWVFKAGYSF